MFAGNSTHFGEPEAEGVQVRAVRESGPVDHQVDVHAPRQFCLDRLGVDPRGGLRVEDWLILPQQKLLEFTAGRVYHDGLGDLGEMRERLPWYPRDVWLYLLAAQWQRIAQQEPFMGRPGEDGVLRAASWQERERHLCAACEAVAHLHNALGITAPLADHVTFFHNRPFRVIHGERFVSAISDAIADQAVRDVVSRAGLIGGIDQITDHVDVLGDPAQYVKLRALYG